MIAGHTFAADPFRPIATVAPVAEPDLRLMELLFADRTLTAAEWAEIAAFEAAAA